jgi:hypothetical protein
MAHDTFQAPQSAADAWGLLVGEWSYTLGTGNSASVSSFRFTAERKMIRSSSLSGGVLPFAITNERTTEVTDVAVKGNAILLTLGDTLMNGRPLGRPGGVMTVRLLASDQLLVEDGPVYLREKSQ